MNINQLFPRKWLYPEDLGGRAVTVTIQAATLEEVRNPATNKTEKKLIISFHKATKRLIANKTQAFAIASAAGSPDTDDWPGKQITLSAAIAPNGKATIHVAPVAVANADHHLDAGTGTDAPGTGADTDPDAGAEDYE